MKLIVDNFVPLSGRHCITNSLKQIFNYQGIAITEAMLFGLGSGLSWFYMENKAVPYPIISGRTRPMDFELALAENMGINIKINKTGSLKKASEGMINLLNHNYPVMLYVDMACLDYLNMPNDAHFGGHSVVVYGVDTDEQLAYISDRDGIDNPLDVNGKILNCNFYEVSLNELAMARDSKFGPFPAQNKWLEFDFKDFRVVTKLMIYNALRKNLNELLNPAIKNLSISGIDKFSRAILNWKSFDDARLKTAAINSFFMIDERGGTGGAAFRNLYSEFLSEAAIICQNQTLELLSNNYFFVTTHWNKLGKGLWQLFETCNRNILPELSDILKKIVVGEYDVLQKMKRFVYEL